MCWSEAASYSMVGIGAVATVVSVRRGDTLAIPLTLGYFTFMEALQAAGYAVVDDCSNPANRTVTLLSYLHIAFQPLFINAFAMTLVVGGVTPRLRRIVFGLAALASLSMILRLMPLAWAGECVPGSVMCGDNYCTISGAWHIGWEVPMNLIWGQYSVFGQPLQFLDYLLAAFLVPMLYGAWRFAIYHVLVGPILASVLTGNPNEMPAVWCLFSIGIILVALLPPMRRFFTPRVAPA